MLVIWRLYFWMHMFVCLSVRLSVFIITPEVMKGSSTFFHVGRVSSKKKILNFMQDPHHMLDTKKKRIFKGPTFHVISMTFFTSKVAKTYAPGEGNEYYLFKIFICVGNFYFFISEYKNISLIFRNMLWWRSAVYAFELNN